MAHKYSLLLEARIQRCSAHSGISCENKVCLGVQHLKADFSQGGGGEGTVLHDRAAVLHVVIVVREGGASRRHGHAVDVVGVGGVAHGVQVGDQILVSDAEAQPRPCQGAGLGEGLGDQEIFILVHQLDRTLCAEIHVGLVDHHHAVGVGLHDGLDLVEGEAESRGGVGVGDDDEAVQAVIFFRIDGEIPFQRHHRGRDAAKLREDLELIEGVYPEFDVDTYLSGEIAPVFFGSAQ